MRNTMLSTCVLCVVALLVGSTQPVSGCLGGLLDVAQPMTDPEGIWVSTVTYSRSCLPSTIVPGYEITFVGKPNCVALENQPEKCGNLNAACLLSITATVESVLLTAYNHRTAISHSGTGLVEANYLWLEITGSADYDDLAQVYSFDDLGRLPRKRKFW